LSFSILLYVFVLIAKKLFTEKGVFPPELVGKNKNCFDFVIDYLKERGVNWETTSSETISN
jgi:hypothetical protein